MSEASVDLTGLADTVGDSVEGSRLELPVGAIMSSGATLNALRVAIEHETALREIAGHYDVDSDYIVTALLEALKARPGSRITTSAVLTEAETDELSAAGVDLSGPPSDYTAERIVTSARLARLEVDALTAGVFAQRASITAARVRQRIKAGSLYAFSRGGEWRLPAWQLFDGQILPGLDMVVPCIDRHLHPLTVAAFMSTTDPDLVVGVDSVSPATWLASGGEPRAVADLLVGVPSAP